jgi:hypothetical protein
MRSGRRFEKVLLLATIVAGLAGCAHRVVVVHDVATKGDAWSLFVDSLTDGPDGFTTGGLESTYYAPAKGERFFWVRIKVRNDAAIARAFNFDRCDLDLADKGIVPVLVATAPMVFKADQVANVAAGDSIDRYLIFAYPLMASPTRLACAPMVIRLPAIALR